MFATKKKKQVMKTVVITGSAGLIGSEATRFFAKLGFDIVGIDNNLRRVFFGEDASTDWNRGQLEDELGQRYHHHNVDIRDSAEVSAIFKEYTSDIALVIHTAAQPSHDWAARDPQMDFTVNANGTLNLLESTRQFAATAPFIFTSTNKVYGDTPNHLPLMEQDLRWEIDPPHRYAQGIGEDMSIDRTLHSLFGASKVAADILVQEYGRYFGMMTACFRGGCANGNAGDWRKRYLVAMSETRKACLQHKSRSSSRCSTIRRSNRHCAKRG